MKRLILWVAVILFFGTLLSGCGGPEPQPVDPHRVETIDPWAPEKDWQ